MNYLKYLPLLAILGKHPNVVKAFSDSLPDIENIANRIEPLIPEAQQMIAEIEAALQKIEGGST